jgi:putative oxidoreductase
MMANLDRWAPQMLSILRIVAALLFWEHGLQKILGLLAATPPRPGPAMFTLIWFAGMIELVFAPLLALGLFTRVSAFILSGEMAVAYWMSHAPRNAIPLLNNGELAIMFCFVFLYIVFAGGGAWAVDNVLRRKGVNVP